VKLLKDWHSCGTANAYILDWGENPSDVDAAGEVSTHEETDVLCRDPAGMIEWELAATQDGSGSWYIPAGYYCTVWQPEDAWDGHWELLHVGQDCQLGSGSGSGSEGSGSGSSGCVTAADMRMDGLPGHSASVKQALIHDENDCLMWMDIGLCPEDEPN
jgi:hypothetical protein